MFKFLSDILEDFDRLDAEKPVDLTDERAQAKAEGAANETENEGTDDDTGE